MKKFGRELYENILIARYGKPHSSSGEVLDFGRQLTIELHKASCPTDSKDYIFRNSKRLKISIAGQTMAFKKPSTPVQKVVACII
jgi:hypothetical protein